ncbi:MAG: type II CAAX endopeptidase family protein [Verrucomicrobiota bacterium]|nr:type II CAAX endopeptidase family protein [Verrucomicrobiota bacterium]
MEELLANPETVNPVLLSPIEYALLIGGLVAALLFALLHRRNPPDPVALTNRLCDRALGFFEIHGIVLLHLFLFILAMFSGRLFYEHQIALAKLGIALAIYSIVSFAIFTNTWRRGGTLASGFGMGIRQLRFAALAPLCYLAAIPLLLLVGAVLKGIGYELPLQENARQFIESGPSERILFAMMATIAAPFFEELLFRGIIFPALLKRMGLASSILLVSSLFALLHFHFFVFLALFPLASLFCILFWPSENRWLIGLTRTVLGMILLFSACITYSGGSFHSFLSLMILSIALCLAYWRTGSLWTSIAMHAIFNAVTLLSLNMAG